MDIRSQHRGPAVGRKIPFFRVDQARDRVLPAGFNHLGNQVRRQVPLFVVRQDYDALLGHFGLDLADQSLGRSLDRPDGTITIDSQQLLVLAGDNTSFGNGMHRRVAGEFDTLDARVGSNLP